MTEDEPCVLPVVSDIADLARAEEIRAQYAAIVESMTPPQRYRDVVAMFL